MVKKHSCKKHWEWEQICGMRVCRQINRIRVYSVRCAICGRYEQVYSNGDIFMIDSELLQKNDWRRASTAQSRKRGKLHLSEKLLHGGYRASCSRTILLSPEVYPKSMLAGALEKNEFCKQCLKIAEANA